MNKIRVLPDNLSNQIAAGEVVERPASVVKELVENSIDAGATHIQIDIELGGRRLMRISDNGEGMMRDDAVLAFERHATSKLKTLEDLSKIETLGFRGEALASIASVAKIELITKINEETIGTRVLIEGGKLRDVKDAARPTGTTISVRDLFFNMPARRKFMRSEATENYHLTAIVTHYALAHPEISFVQTNNGREVLRVSPAKDLRERAYQLFGANLIESLLKVEGGREYLAKITGFVSAPRERRTTRDAQYFFINGRFVRDKVIAGGILEGFRAVLPHGVYPVAFLFLEIPLEEVDVNVHPAKTEVRFRRAEAVKETIAGAIRQALMSAGIVSESQVSNSKLPVEELNYPINLSQNREIQQQKIEFAVETPINDLEIRQIENELIETNGQNDNFQLIIESEEFENTASERNAESEQPGKNLSEEVLKSDTWNFESEISNFQSKKTEDQNPQITEQIRNPKSEIQNSSMPPVDSGAKIPKSIEVEHLSSSKIRPVGQLHESYIIAVDAEGMLLVDQHVAHERILFDKFRRRESARKIESQNLLLPETFDLTPAQAAAFDLIEKDLEELGFSLMRLSGRTIAVKAIPVDLPAKEVRNLLAEVLDTVDREKRGNAIENIRDDIAASLACKAAVKVNMKLTPEKMQWLIDKLITTSSPTTCPHGRPVILRLTMKDIERGFHRT